MKIIRMTPNESGAYGQIQEGGVSKVPEGMALWPEDMSAETFYAYNGFVHLSFEENETGAVVTDCQPNVEAFEAWEAGHSETEENGEDEPTQLDRVEAQATYTAMMTDTLLEV